MYKEELNAMKWKSFLEIRRYFCISSFSLCFLLAPVIISNAQLPGFSGFKNQVIPRPSGLPRYKATDFRVNPKRIYLLKNEFLFADHRTLEKLCSFLLTDKRGQKLWAGEAANAAEILNKWDFTTNVFAGNRYVFVVNQLQNLSLVYLLSGEPALGQFIRGHVMQITGLPYEFWLNSELRGYNPDHPVGGLETAQLCTTLSFVLSAAKDLFPIKEKERIDAALYNKGLIPCLNWLEKPWKNNWTAVLSNGAYAASKYLNHQEGVEKSLKGMAIWLETIQQDGSYGEGMGYFDYPVRSLLPSILIMKNDKLEKTFLSSGLKYSSQWQACHYLFQTKEGRTIPTVVDFGDNGYMGDSSFSGPTEQKSHLILAMLYEDHIASWLIGKFGGLMSLEEWLFFYSFHKDGVLPAPKSPEKAGLPLIKVFDSGDCFIRSTWDDSGIVMAMWSGCHSRTGATHRRPEAGSIGMGAYGEYLIVSPASASYRSPLHYLWDRTTKAANTITVDDKNQLFPGKGKSSWVEIDNSEFWMEGMPKTEIVQHQSGKLADLIVNEAALAYHVPMKHVRRSIMFVRDPGYFVMIDKIEAVDSSHKYSWRIHLNNRDSLGKIEEINDGHWRFLRPLAGLDIYLFADQKLETNIGEGYIHGPVRDYSPGGVNEGKAGSSIELEAFNLEKYKSLTFYSVLFPSKEGMVVPHIEFRGNTVCVGKDKLADDGTNYVLLKDGQTERFKLDN